MVTRLRNGDEQAFVALVSRYQQPMLRLARSFVPSQAVAEEAVQDTWLGLVRGIENFAPTEALHAVDPARFNAEGQWADPVDKWIEESEQRLDAAAWSPILKAALEDLPARQRQVVLLRDVEGLSHDEACSVLGISVGNQRVLLHRGRSQLRGILEAKMGKG
jgi:RNA polymerase sigma-70 factor (ECF subfamily)